MSNALVSTKTASKYATDTKSDAQEIAEKYQRNPSTELEDRMVKVTKGFVRSIALRHRRADDSLFDDLLSVGSMGVLKALRDYDTQRNVQFTTYASTRIHGEIFHFLRDQKDIIRRPAWAQEFYHKARSTRAKLTMKLGREPEDGELARALGTTVQDLQHKLELSNPITVLVGPMAFNYEDEDAEELGERRKEPRAACDGAREEHPMSFDERISLYHAIDQLVNMRKGGSSYRQIAITFGINPGRAQEICRRIDQGQPLEA